MQQAVSIIGCFDYSRCGGNKAGGHADCMPAEGNRIDIGDPTILADADLYLQILTFIKISIIIIKLFERSIFARKSAPAQGEWGVG